MPQMFHVLRCYKCSVFQVHQTTKSDKWECKLCGEKQSVKRFYGLGTAKECRFHVQKLNGMRGEIDGQKNNKAEESDDSKCKAVTPPVKITFIPVKNSKWTNYLEEPKKSNVAVNTDESQGGAKVVSEIPNTKNEIKKSNVTLNTVQTLRVPKLILKIPKAKNETINSNVAVSTGQSLGGPKFVLELPKTKKEIKKSNVAVNTDVDLEIPKKRRKVNAQQIPKFTMADHIQTEDAFESQFAWSEIVPETSSSVGSIQSNVPQTSLYSANVVAQKINKNNIKNKFVAPIINQSSKWAQFLDETNDSQSDSIATSHTLGPARHNLFSWCDEEDLDYILDI